MSDVLRAERSALPTADGKGYGGSVVAENLIDETDGRAIVIGLVTDATREV
jgi:hypothetical protein